MTDREIMQQALEALEGIHVDNMTPMAEENWNKALTVLRQALAQPEQEELIQFMDGKWSYVRKPWVGLTDDEIKKIVDLNTSDDGGFDIWCDGIAVARIVCAKLKGNNT